MVGPVVISKNKEIIFPMKLRECLSKFRGKKTQMGFTENRDTNFERTMYRNQKTTKVLETNSFSSLAQAKILNIYKTYL